MIFSTPISKEKESGTASVESRATYFVVSRCLKTEEQISGLHSSGFLAGEEIIVPLDLCPIHGVAHRGLAVSALSTTVSIPSGPEGEQLAIAKASLIFRAYQEHAQS